MREREKKGYEKSCMRERLPFVEPVVVDDVGTYDVDEDDDQ